MVQILNKMVHLNLKYPILEIWCWHKHITQLPPSRLKFDTKLWKQSGSIALHKSLSQAKYSTQFCLFVLANQMQACKTQIFGYLWHFLLFSNAFLMHIARLKCGEKLRNTSPSRFVSTALHKLKSLLQAKYGYVKYCM